MKLSVLVPTRNTRPYLRRCLESLFKYKSSGTEILIHVDGATDDTVAWLKNPTDLKVPAGSIEFTVGEQVGCYASYNLLAKRAKGEYILIFQDDMVVSEGFEEAIFKHIKKDVLISPKSFERSPFGMNPFTFSPEKFDNLVKNTKEGRLVPCIKSTCVMKRSLFFDIGGFDEFYKPYGLGDRDILYQLFTKHPETKSYMALDFVVYHFCSASTEDSKKEYPWEELGPIQENYFIKKNGISPGGDEANPGFNQWIEKWGGLC